MRTITAMTLALLLTACTSVVPAGPTPKLSGTSWTLSGILDGTTTTPAVEGPPLTVKFDGTSLTGKACNNFRAPYTLTGATISIGLAASTQMACVDASVMAQEAQVFGLLPTLTTVQLDGDTLTLTAPDGRGLKFAKA
jgi:heat shock protein HslJ